MNQIEIITPYSHYWSGTWEFLEVLTSCKTLASYELNLN